VVPIHASAVKAAHPDPVYYSGPSYVSTRILFGFGTLAMLDSVLADELAINDARRPLLISGRLDAAKPWQTSVCETIAAFGGETIENPTPNPTFESIAHLYKQARHFDADYIVAAGGGSVIDAAKAVAAMLAGGGDIRDILARNDKTLPAVPIIALPSTAGTGSEVTSSASIWDEQSKRKHSLAMPSLYPRIAIVDPELTVSMPRHVVAGTGLDALAHGIETAMSVNSDEESIGRAILAVQLINDNLESRLSDACSESNIEAVAQAAMEAGLGIARGQTTISHAISYPLTARYGVHHGHACSLSLGELLIFNAAVSDDDCLDTRGARHVKDVIGRILGALRVTSPQAARARIRRLIGSGGLKNFDEYAAFDLSVIANDVIHYDRFKNNPRSMNHDQLAGFIKKLAAGPAV